MASTLQYTTQHVYHPYVIYAFHFEILEKSLLDTRFLCLLGYLLQNGTSWKTLFSLHMRRQHRGSCSVSCCDLHRWQQRDMRELVASSYVIVGPQKRGPWAPSLLHSQFSVMGNTCNSRHPFVVKLSWLAHMWVSRCAQVSFERL